jgi:hypothetical protein
MFGIIVAAFMLGFGIFQKLTKNQVSLRIKNSHGFLSESDSYH